MILLWLLPPAVVTISVMLWVAWLGREGRGAVDRDEAVHRLGVVLEARQSGRRRHLWSRRRPLPGYAVAPRTQDRSSGVAVRRGAGAAAPPDLRE